MNVALIILILFNLAWIGFIGGIIEVIFKKQRVLIEETKILIEGQMLVFDALKKLLTK